MYIVLTVQVHLTLPRVFFETASVFLKAETQEWFFHNTCPRACTSNWPRTSTMNWSWAIALATILHSAVALALAILPSDMAMVNGYSHSYDCGYGHRYDCGYGHRYCFSWCYWKPSIPRKKEKNIWFFYALALDMAIALNISMAMAKASSHLEIG